MKLIELTESLTFESYDIYTAAVSNRLGAKYKNDMKGSALKNFMYKLDGENVKLPLPNGNWGIFLQQPEFEEALRHYKKIIDRQYDHTPVKNSKVELHGSDDWKPIVKELGEFTKQRPNLMQAMIKMLNDRDIAETMRNGDNDHYSGWVKHAQRFADQNGLDPVLDLNSGSEPFKQAGNDLKTAVTRHDRKGNEAKMRIGSTLKGLMGFKSGGD